MENFEQGYAYYAKLASTYSGGLLSEKYLSSIKKEIDETKDGYVFLFALNALQYSHTDDMLTREDWTKFKEKKFPNGVEYDHFGADYAQRIITDALELWPERRNVD